MLDIQKYIGAPKIKAHTVNETTMRFEVNFLPRGLGHSLGNAMRRVILGYNVGGGITGMKIKGVPHEYHVIDGVKESVVDIMQNFKALRFAISDKVEQLQWVSQKFKGARAYTAKDLKLPSGVELLDEDAYLCEISDPESGISIRFITDEAYPYLQLYTPPDRKSIAIENLSSAPNCFNNGIGLLKLAPGESKTMTVHYSVQTKETN